MKRYLYILILMFGCKDVYNPPLKNSTTNYLVVEGNIIAGSDSTFIHLSRSTAINDTNGTNKPEINASINVESEDGESYALQSEFNGMYDAPPLNINPNKNYRLHIFTADGKEYASDYVPVKITPAIDSVSWKLNAQQGVDIFVNTHDALSNTQYYRWLYDETWEHRPKDYSELIYDKMLKGVRNRLPDEQIYRCWNTDISNEIFIGSTTGLLSDNIFEKQLVEIPYQSEKIDRVYSILVTQFALTKEAFEYWDNLKKNTESIGSIFDPQPFTNFGNIHCITEIDEPVIGFISACSVLQKRIFINWSQVQWPYSFPSCKDTMILAANVDDFFSQDNTYIPVRRVFSPPGSVVGDFIECVDCRLHGGSTIKPPYMP